MVLITAFYPRHSFRVRCPFMLEDVDGSRQSDIRYGQHGMEKTSSPLQRLSSKHSTAESSTLMKQANHIYGRPGSLPILLAIVFCTACFSTPSSPKTPITWFRSCVPPFNWRASLGKRRTDRYPTSKPTRRRFGEPMRQSAFRVG